MLPARLMETKMNFEYIRFACIYKRLPNAVSEMAYLLEITEAEALFYLSMWWG